MNGSCGTLLDDGVAACAAAAAGAIHAKGMAIPTAVVVKASGSVCLASPDAVASPRDEVVGVYMRIKGNFTKRALAKHIAEDIEQSKTCQLIAAEKRHDLLHRQIALPR